MCQPEAPSQQGVSSGGGPAAMPLSRLDHVNLRTAELAAMQTFYSEVLGMSLGPRPPRSEEHTSELQSLMRISYAVFCLKKKKLKTKIIEYVTSNFNIKTLQTI